MENYIVRAANVWWRCAQYLVIGCLFHVEKTVMASATQSASHVPHCCFFKTIVARCIETIDVCIWRMFIFMSVVVIVWGSVRMFVV